MGRWIGGGVLMGALAAVMASATAGGPTGVACCDDANGRRVCGNPLPAECYGRKYWLVDDSASQESVLAEAEEADNRHVALRNALGVLNERERRIFEARRLAEDPMTLEDLSTEFGVSRERVRQIEVRAFEKVQEAVKAQAREQVPAVVEAG